jgi:hypothetical protein
VGLANVRSRLAARYGEEAWLRVDAGPERFRVEISLPVEAGTGESGMENEKMKNEK